MFGFLGLLYRLTVQTYPLYTSHWTPAEIPDQTGKVFIVTGGYTGIGYETCKALLGHNATVYILGRSASKAETAIKSLKASTGKDIKGFLIADLGDLKSVRAAVEDFKSKEAHLDVLINNAGVMMPPPLQKTAQGYDLQFGTNVIAHYHLTTLLIPQLLKSHAHTGVPSRVVNVSSIGHDIMWGLGIQYDQLKPEGLSEKDILPVTSLYGISKIGNIMFANELNKKFESQGIISSSLHPGAIRSELSRHSGSGIRNIVTWLSHPAEKGAYNQLWLATSEEGLKLGGKYVVPWTTVVDAQPAATDPKNCEELWAWLEKECQGY